MSRFRPCGAKVSSFTIQKFSRCFSLSFSVSFIVVRVFLTNSMIMNFPWLLKSWCCLLKYSQTGIALEFLTSCLWLLSLIFCNFDLDLMCQCFIRISFRLGNAGLYIRYWQRYKLFIMTFLLVKQLFLIKLVNFLNLHYICFVSFINIFFIKFSRGSVVVLERWTYSSNSKCLAVGNTFL